MRWLAQGSLALALAATATGPAVADPLTHEGRVTVGPVWDSNPGRLPDPAPSSAGIAWVLSLDAASPGRSHLTSLSLDTGLRGYFSESRDNEVATLLSVGHAQRFADPVAAFVSGTVKDLRSNDPALFDYTDASASGGLDLGPFSRLAPRIYGGVERFQYRPNLTTYAFTAALAGASVLADLGSGHALTASWDGSFRHFAHERHNAQILSLDWSYRGRWLFGAGYQIALVQDDPVLGTNRQRIQARAGVPLPATLVLSVDAALYLSTINQAVVDTDSVSSLGAKLTLPLGAPFLLEGSFRWYSSVGSGSAVYDRKLAGLALAADF